MHPLLVTTFPCAMFSQDKSFLDYFRPQQDPKELVRKWQSTIRTEMRKLDRQIIGEIAFALLNSTVQSDLRRMHANVNWIFAVTEIQREEKKAQKPIKEAAKRGDLVSAKVDWLRALFSCSAGPSEDMHV